MPLGCWGLVAAGVAPRDTGVVGASAPRGCRVCGFVAVGAGARVKGTAMAGGPRVTDSAAAAQALVEPGGGVVCHTVSAAAGSLEPQAKPPGPGPQLRRCFHHPYVLSPFQVPTFSCRGV